MLVVEIGDGDGKTHGGQNRVCEQARDAQLSMFSILIYTVFIVNFRGTTVLTNGGFM